MQEILVAKMIIDVFDHVLSCEKPLNVFLLRSEKQKHKNHEFPI